MWERDRHFSYKFVFIIEKFWECVILEKCMPAGMDLSLYILIYGRRRAMNLEIKGYRIVKCDYTNNVKPNSPMNIRVNMNNQINIPKTINKGTVGTVLTKVMVGSPMEPLYIYLEQICAFADTDKDAPAVTDRESMLSLYKTICVPAAVRTAQDNIQKLCEAFNIPKLKLQDQGDQKQYS